MSTPSLPARLVGVGIFLGGCSGGGALEPKDARWLEPDGRPANLAVAVDVRRAQEDPVYGPSTKKALARDSSPMLAVLASAAEIDAVAIAPDGDDGIEGWTAVVHGLGRGSAGPDVIDGRFAEPAASPGSGIVEYPPVPGRTMSLFVLPDGTWAMCGAPSAPPLRRELARTSSAPLARSVRSGHIVEFSFSGAAIRALGRHAVERRVLDRLESISGSISTGDRAELTARLHYANDRAAALAEDALLQPRLIASSPPRIARDGSDLAVVRRVGPAEWERLITSAAGLLPPPQAHVVPTYDRGEP